MAITQECCVQSWQVLAATPHKTPTVRPPAPITKTIQVRRTRHAGHCWRSRDELIRDVLLWIPTHGRAKAGRPARTYIQQLCEDTRCCPEDLPRAMNDREEWPREGQGYPCCQHDMMMMMMKRIVPQRSSLFAVKTGKPFLDPKIVIKGLWSVFQVGICGTLWRWILSLEPLSLFGNIASQLVVGM